MSTNAILYVDTFTQPYPSPAVQNQYADWLTDLNGSGFTTAILYNLHIDPVGNLRYTNAQTPLIADGKLQKGYEYLPELLASLTQGSFGSVLFCLGGWGSEGDYVNCGNLFARYGTGTGNPVVRNLVALQAMGISGIDIDLEVGAGNYASLQYAYFQPIVAQLTSFLAYELHLDVTYCPYEAPQFWLDCMACGYAQFGAQPVSWLNLQCYDGGSGNTQSQWAGYITAYDKAANSPNSTSLGPLGISTPAAFVIPGYGSAGEYGSSPAAVQSDFSDSSKMAAGVTGGFIYTYAGILYDQQHGTYAPNNTTADYASAIIDGIDALQG